MDTYHYMMLMNWCVSICHVLVVRFAGFRNRKANNAIFSMTRNAIIRRLNGTIESTCSEPTYSVY